MNVRLGGRTGRHIVLVLDNGVPFNSRLARTALEAALPYVRAFRLQKCTSETFNWIENSWDCLKKTYFSWMLTAQRAAFHPNAVRLLRRLRRSGRMGHLALRVPPERIHALWLSAAKVRIDLVNWVGLIERTTYQGCGGAIHSSIGGALRTVQPERCVG
ncbi:hypothetical protein MVI01_02520 [Myxococcus virescens]|nr:hypothetical protein MVI01_02520 [Myxococcus virescens]